MGSVVYSRVVGDPKRIMKRASAIVAGVTLRVEGEAKSRCPVDTGYLRSSINSRVGQFEGSVDVGAEYASYVNFGTTRQRAQPFFTQAEEDGRRLLDREMRKLEDEFR